MMGTPIPMFSSDRTPARAERVKVAAGCYVALTFAASEPISRYYRPERGAEPRPWQDAPDPYAITSVYVVEATQPAPIKGADPDAIGAFRSGPRSRMVLYVERTLLVAFEREAAHIRHFHEVARFPVAGDVWTVARVGDAWRVECHPVV